MQVTGLKLTQFRNYETLSLRFQPGVTVFYGDNAQGKTNILEALFLCCTGRSHRTPRDRELLRWGQTMARVEVELRRKEGLHHLDIRLQDTKQIFINGMQAARIGQLMGYLNCVIFSPEDLRLVKEGPQERRRFMDMELSQTRPAYFFTLQRYHRVLAQRNHLLRLLRQGQAAHAAQLQALTAWDEQLAALGAALMAQRQAFVEDIAQLALRIHNEVSQHTEMLSMVYRPGLPGAAGLPGAGEQVTADDLLQGLARERERDISQAATSVGPHRDDLQLRLNGRDARLYASQGQQRSCALSLKLAQIQYMGDNTGELPILLLDDVMSELDDTRCRMLLTYVRQVQTFITTTGIGIRALPDCDVQRMHVVQGQVFPE